MGCPVLRPGSVVTEGTPRTIRDALSNNRSLLKLLDRHVQTIDRFQRLPVPPVSLVRCETCRVTLFDGLVTLAYRLAHQGGGPIEGVH